MKIKDAIIDDSIDYIDFHNILVDNNAGNWEDCQTTDAIIDHIKGLIGDGYPENKLNQTIDSFESQSCETDAWKLIVDKDDVWAFEPIKNKQELANCIKLTESELNIVI